MLYVCAAVTVGRAQGTLFILKSSHVQAQMSCVPLENGYGE